jgi:hypothetical protein
MKKTPLQVYLDDRDRRLLMEIAERERLSLAETLREAIRRWALEATLLEDPLLDLIGVMSDTAAPGDLSTRHDEFAVKGWPEAGTKQARKRHRKAV